MVQPLDLIKTARRLTRNKGKPRQSDLKRALSTAYYALFHETCGQCANLLVGSAQSNRSPEAWAQAYRAVEHGFAKNQCKNTEIMQRFPTEIQDFGRLFIELQKSRHAADYDPEVRFRQSEVISEIDRAELAIKSLRQVDIKDRRAFAVWVIMKKRID